MSRRPPLTTVLLLVLALAALLVLPGRATAAVQPPPPRGVSVAVSPATQSATLRWEPPADDGSGPVTGYRVSRDGVDLRGEGAWSRTVPAGTRSQSVTSLRPGDRYRLGVEALRAGGASTPVVLTAALPAARPGPVRQLDAGDFGPVRWEAPAFDGGAPVTGYRVSRDGTDAAGVGPTSVVLPAGTTSYLFTTLRDGARYTVTVEALNAVGAGEPARSDLQMPPAPPGSLDLRVRQEPETRSATVSWPEPDDRGSAITQYVVTWVNADDTSEHVFVVLGGGTRQFRMGPLRHATRYEVEVVDENGSDAGGGGRISFTTPGLPSAPVRADATAVPGAVRVTWAPPADDGGLPVVGYRVLSLVRDRAGLGETTTLVAGSARSLDLPARPGARYAVRVQADNAYGTGSAAGAEVTVPARVPGPPTAVRVALDGQARLGTVAWEAPVDDGGAEVVGYRVARVGPGADGAPAAAFRVAAGVRTQTFVGLVPGTPYTFHVQALTAAGTGPTGTVRATAGG